jgi:hypothetical protein
VLNVRLLSSPMNWLTIWSMALVAFFVGHLLICYFYGVHPGAPQQLTGGQGGVVGPGTADTTNSASNN